MPETNPFKQFVAQCESLLAIQGRPKTCFVNGSLHRDANAFDTPGIEIVSGPGRSLEITLKYRTPEGQVRSNPVVCRSETGEVYRCHGEWQYGVERVRRLSAGEYPNGPITLGPGAQGWTAGLD